MTGTVIETQLKKVEKKKQNHHTPSFAKKIRDNPTHFFLKAGTKKNMMQCYFLGKRSYREVLGFQEAFFAAKVQRQRAIALARLQGAGGTGAAGSSTLPPLLPDAVFAVEHSAPQYTMGRRDTSEGLNEIPVENVVHTRRGGALTWHGPGQLTCYPIVNIQKLWKQSTDPEEVKGKSPVRWFSTVLEESMIGAIQPYGIIGERGCVGAWVGNKKIGSIGLQLSDWVSMHGIGLNVANDLSYFDKIVMCAMPGRQATSLHQELLQKETGEERHTIGAADPSPDAAAAGSLSLPSVEEVYQQWVVAYQKALANPNVSFTKSNCVDVPLDKLLLELTSPASGGSSS